MIMNDIKIFAKIKKNETLIQTVRYSARILYDNMRHSLMLKTYHEKFLIDCHFPFVDISNTTLAHMELKDQITGNVWGSPGTKATIKYSG